MYRTPQLTFAFIHLRQARRIAPEKMSLPLGDMLYRMYFMERNMKLLIDYTENWPLMNFPGFVLPELLQIFVLSKKLGVTSPIPKIQFVNAGSEGSKKIFGWDGSVGFTEASALRTKVSSGPPTTVSSDAINQVMFEVEEAMASSATLDSVMARISASCITSSLGESCSMCSSTGPVISSTQLLTSPIPPRKNPSTGAKTSRKDHSNKGSVNSHKINLSKLQLSVKVNNFYFYGHKCCIPIFSFFLLAFFHKYRAL